MMASYRTEPRGRAVARPTVAGAREAGNLKERLMSTNPLASASDPAVGEAAVSPDAVSAASTALAAEGDILEIAINQDSFGIRLTDTIEGRNSASLLINKMYAWRGYAGTHRLNDDPNRVTLTATDKQGAAVGTLTIGIDSPIGLLADEIFKEELDAYRGRGARICEFTKLAFDPTVQSKEALASLFHLATCYARDLYGCTDIFIEVNPRHRRFYERMLGFQRHGEARSNPRVNAPAFLLAVNLDYVTEQIAKFGGTSDTAAGERSFYPYFFSPREERGIIDRLLAIDERKTETVN
jgi:hypothetical protein